MKTATGNDSPAPRLPPALLLLLAAAAVAAPWRAAAPKVFAHANDTDEWVAHVTKVDDHLDAPYDTTAVFDRAEMGGQWLPLEDVTRRVVSMASVGPEAALLTEDGEWRLGSPASGTRLGPTPPGGVRLVALASDGDALWAIADVPGGLAGFSATRPAAAAPATDPSAPDAAGGPAAAAPATHFSGPQILPATNPVSRLVLLEFVNGSWAPPGPQLPDEVTAGVAPPSLAVVNHQPFVAYQAADGKVRVAAFTPGRGAAPTTTDAARRQAGRAAAPAGKWDGVPLEDAGFPAARFAMLSFEQSPLLWVSGGADNWGVVYHGKQLGKRSALKKTGDAPDPDARAVTVGGGRIRLVMLGTDGKLYEQVYDPSDAQDFAKPVGTLSAIELPAGPAPEFAPWLVGTVALTAMAAAAAAANRRAVAREPVRVAAGGDADPRRGWARRCRSRPRRCGWRRGRSTRCRSSSGCWPGLTCRWPT